MYAKFKYERIPLSLISLDDRNPRIVTQEKLKSQDEIIRYLFEYEELGPFLKKIASETRNQGAERPYIIKSGKEYVVVEGNTRIATYKLLAGLVQAPPDYIKDVPLVSTATKEELLTVDCTIAPSRDALLPIMAAAHFGRGDKSKWGYLGSRKAVYDEWSANKTISQLASVFDKTQGEIRDYLVEYALYLEALQLDWTAEEQKILTSPAVQFNPPVRFLQSVGHKNLTGIELDRINLKVKFNQKDSRQKLKHLVSKTVINAGNGLTATSTYADVFQDYKEKVEPSQSDQGSDAEGDKPKDSNTGGGGNGDDKPEGNAGEGSKLKNGALFNYTVKSNDLLLRQLMKEASSLNCKSFPAAGTALLRSLVEVILKNIVDDQGGNPQNKWLSLETALDICLGANIKLPQADKKILKEFKKDHMDYVNLGTHGTVIGNYLRLCAVRDSIDQFIKRNV